MNRLRKDFGHYQTSLHLHNPHRHKNTNKFVYFNSTLFFFNIQKSVMGLLDSDSEDDCSDLGNDEEVSLGDDDDDDVDKAPVRRVGRNNSSCSTGSARSVTEGTVEERLSALMGLKADIGIDQDPDERRKAAKREEIAKANEEEQTKLANMSEEERFEAQKNDVGSLMDKIRAKRQLSQKNLMKKDNGEAPAEVKKTTKEEDDMAEFRRLKLKKSNSKKKLLRKKSMDKAVKTPVAAS